MVSPYTSKLYAIIDYPDPYVQPLILDSLKSQPQSISIELITSVQQLPSLDSPLLQFAAYESLDLEHAIAHPKSSVICAYIIRKALIRKHYLSNTVSTWLVKHPQSCLKRHFKAAVNFELDYAEFLDEALVDAWDLNESMERNEELGADSTRREWWILKPGMSDGGNGIRMFSSMQQLYDIFEDWEKDEEGEEGKEKKEDTGEEDEREDEKQKLDEQADDVMGSAHETMTSQLRHFIAQPYIDPPLLLHSRGNRKFHTRVYVLAVGALRVYVCKEMLALFAPKPYQSLYELRKESEVDLASHLTNTCMQDDSALNRSVAQFWDLEDLVLPPDGRERIFKQICQVSGEVFEAAAREQTIHFQTMPNAFEIFGVDFLVDAALGVWLLELNAYPDFKQTGQRLQEAVVGRLFHSVVKTAVLPFFDLEVGESGRGGSDELVLVRNIDLGRR